MKIGTVKSLTSLRKVCINCNEAASTVWETAKYCPKHHGFSPKQMRSQIQETAKKETATLQRYDVTGLL